VQNSISAVMLNPIDLQTNDVLSISKAIDPNW
jgi:hypothetical protein